MDFTPSTTKRITFGVWIFLIIAYTLFSSESLSSSSPPYLTLSGGQSSPSSTSDVASEGLSLSAHNEYVVFATDCTNMQYASLAVLSAYVWKHHMNITPVVFIQNNPSKIGQFLIGLIESFGGQVHPISTRHQDLISSTMQNVRIAAFQHQMFQPDDVIITADADIWPLNSTFWTSAVQQSKNSIYIYNGPFYESQRASGSQDFVALSFVGASVRDWRLLYHSWCSRHNLTAFPSGNLHQTLWQILDAGAQHYGSEAWNGNGEGNKYGPQWSWDQVMAGMWLEASNQCPDKCVVNKNVVRLDRSDFRWNEDKRVEDRLAIQTFTDSHLPFPLHDNDVYKKLERLWIALFGSTTILSSVRDGVITSLAA